MFSRPCCALAAMTAAVFLAAAPARAAETVHLFLTLDGNQVQGDSTQVSLGRANSIMCFLFRTSLRAVPGGTGTTVEGGTVTCRKPLDRSTPLLIRGLAQQQAAVLNARFYRPNPSGDGTTQHFYTLSGVQGRIVAIKQLSPDVLNPASTNSPAMEEVTFEFRSVTYIYEDGGVVATWP